MNSILQQKIEQYLSRPASELYTITDLGYLSPCWISTLLPRSDGYCRVTFLTGSMFKRYKSGKKAYRHESVYLHRIFYEKYKGPIKRFFDIDHLCRNKSCCNPEHLEQVPEAINIRRGLSAKLTIEKVEEIRELHEKKELTQTELAKQFNMSQAHISDIVNNKVW